MIKSEFKTNLIDYLLLSTTAIFFIVSLGLLEGQKRAQFALMVFFIFIYISWGIIHHKADNSLHLKIVLEYILIGAIALFLLQALFL